MAATLLPLPVGQLEHELIENDSQRENDAEVGYEREHGESLQLSDPATHYDEREDDGYALLWGEAEAEGRLCYL